MSATSTVPIVKESIGWSIVLSVLMIVAGFLAIAIPAVAGIAVNLLVGWMLIFSGGAHLVYAWQTRHNHGFILELLLGVLYFFRGWVLAHQPHLGSCLAHARTFVLSMDGRSVGIRFVLSPSVDAWSRLASF